MKTRPTAGDRRPEATAATSPTSSPQPTTYSIERLPPVEDPRRDPGVQTAAFAAAPGSVAAQDQPPQFAAGARAETVPATYQEEVPKPRGNPAAPSAPRLTDRLKIPPELPGANVPPLTLPPWNQPEKKMAVIELLFPDLHPMPPLAPPPPERRMSLAELEQMAVANSPIVAQAAADVTIALGTAIQVGVYPNPVIGYEADTVGSAGTRNYQGVFGTQVIKTANKLGLAHSVANVDLMNAELALRKARVELLAQVKANYFAVLVAQENVMISDRLVRFTGVSYEIQDDKLIGGLASAYEAAQLRSLANQARTTLIQAQNSYVSAWKQLAATVGLPGLPMARLEETAEMPVPRLSFEAALERMLSVHTDMRTREIRWGRRGCNYASSESRPFPM